jgi:hypothetical protein
MKYYDLEENWGKVESYLSHPTVKEALKRGMDDLLSKWNRKFDETKVPRDYEWNNWHWEFDYESEPKYWKYTLFNACFWLVDFNLELAKLAEPDENWVIVRNDKHATVWNGEDIIFEFNLMAFGWTADDCYQLSMKGLSHGK